MGFLLKNDSIFFVGASPVYKMFVEITQWPPSVLHLALLQKMNKTQVSNGVNRVAHGFLLLKTIYQYLFWEFFGCLFGNNLLKNFCLSSVYG